MAGYESPDFGGGADLPTVAPNALQPYSPLNLPAAGPMPSLPALPRADVASSPMMDIGRMLMGFAAGTQGRMNPIMQYEEEQRARASQQLLAQQQMALNERARVTQERQFDLNQKIEERRVKTDEERLSIEKNKLATEMGLKLIEHPDAEIRVQGYKLLQQAGKLASDADPARLSLLTKTDFSMARDEAIGLLEAGLDPAAPTFGGRYNFLPLDAYKEMAKANPLGLNSLRTKPMTEDQSLKAVVARISALPPEKVLADPGLQQQLKGAQSALTLTQKVNYGERVNAELASMGVKDPHLATAEQMAEAIRRASVEQGPPTIDRVVAREQKLMQQISEARTPQELVELKGELVRVRQHKASIIEAQAQIAGGRTTEVEKNRPLPEGAQKELQAYNQVMSTLQEFKTFTPEEIQKYTGILNNPIERAKMALAGVTGGKVDERFAQFQAIMGRFKQNLFALGGKQLTGMEMRVATASTPTGTEPGGAAEMLAKVRYMEAFTRVSRKVFVALHQVGKGYVDPDMMDSMMAEELKKAGVALPGPDNPRPWMSKTAAPPGYKPVR